MQLWNYCLSFDLKKSYEKYAKNIRFLKSSRKILRIGEIRRDTLCSFNFSFTPRVYQKALSLPKQTYFFTFCALELSTILNN